MSTNFNHEVFDVLTKRERFLIKRALAWMRKRKLFTKYDQGYVLGIVEAYYRDRYTNEADTLIRKLQHLKPVHFITRFWQNGEHKEDPDWEKGLVRVSFTDSDRTYMPLKEYYKFARAPFKWMVRQDLF